MEGVPAMAGGWNWMIFKILSNPNHSVILLLYDIQLFGAADQIQEQIREQRCMDCDHINIEYKYTVRWTENGLKY